MHVLCLDAEALLWVLSDGLALFSPPELMGHHTWWENMCFLLVFTSVFLSESHCITNAGCSGTGYMGLREEKLAEQQ